MHFALMELISCMASTAIQEFHSTDLQAIRSTIKTMQVRGEIINPPPKSHLYSWWCAAFSCSFYIPTTWSPL